MIKQLDLFAAFAAAEVQPVPMPAASPVKEKVVDEESCALLRQWQEIKEQYPDALLYCGTPPFFDREDILRIAAKPFDPKWYFLERSHLRMLAADKSGKIWRTQT